MEGITVPEALVRARLDIHRGWNLIQQVKNMEKRFPHVFLIHLGPSLPPPLPPPPPSSSSSSPPLKKAMATFLRYLGSSRRNSELGYWGGSEEYMMMMEQQAGSSSPTTTTTTTTTITLFRQFPEYGYNNEVVIRGTGEIAITSEDWEEEEDESGSSGQEEEGSDDDGDNEGEGGKKVEEGEIEQVTDDGADQFVGSGGGDHGLEAEGRQKDDSRKSAEEGGHDCGNTPTAVDHTTISNISTSTTTTTTSTTAKGRQSKGGKKKGKKAKKKKKKPNHRKRTGLKGGGEGRASHNNHHQSPPPLSHSPSSSPTTMTPDLSRTPAATTITTGDVSKMGTEVMKGKKDQYVWVEILSRGGVIGEEDEEEEEEEETDALQKVKVSELWCDLDRTVTYHKTHREHAEYNKMILEGIGLYLQACAERGFKVTEYSLLSAIKCEMYYERNRYYHHAHVVSCMVKALWALLHAEELVEGREWRRAREALQQFQRVRSMILVVMKKAGPAATRLYEMLLYAAGNRTEESTTTTSSS